MVKLGLKNYKEWPSLVKYSNTRELKLKFCSRWSFNSENDFIEYIS